MVLTQPKPATRDLILDATEHLLGRYGFRKMTMDDVAKEAGVSKRTIYMYFSTKEDLVLSFLRRVVERVQAEITEILASDGRPSDKLRTVLFRRIEVRVVGLKDYSHCLDQIFEGVRTRYLEQRQEFFDQESKMIAEFLELGRSSGDFRFDDAQGTARVLLIATGALVPYSLSVKEMGGLDSILKDLRATVDLLVDGLENHS